MVRRPGEGAMVAAQSSPVSGFVFAAAGAVAGQAGLGALLTAAFLLQVTPSLWTAYRTARPTGIPPERGCSSRARAG